jgi:hypothetical protein
MLLYNYFEGKDMAGLLLEESHQAYNRIKESAIFYPFVNIYEELSGL